MNPPLVCLDCSPLLVRSAGVKTYLYHWLKSLQALDSEAVCTFLAPSNLSDLRHGGGLRQHPFRLAALQAINRLPGFICNATVPACDLFHTSNLLRTMPRRRLSTTIHDMTTWLMPEHHTGAIVAAEKRLAESVFRSAAGIIAVSDNTRRDAIRILGIEPDRVRVIYPGISPAYSSVTPEAAKQAREAFGITRPFFLSVGTIEPRKNIDSLLSAWEKLPQAFRKEHELVVVGMPGWKASVTMQRLMRASEENSGIRYLGYVAENRMPGLTAAALALVYPSLYEGFGFPVAQAMAAGCPVITSNVSSLPEITNGAAVLVEPRDVAGLAEAIVRVAGSADLRERMRSEGLQNSRRFTWENTAVQSMQFFGEIARG